MMVNSSAVYMFIYLDQRELIFHTIKGCVKYAHNYLVGRSILSFIHQYLFAFFGAHYNVCLLFNSRNIPAICFL